MEVLPVYFRCPLNHIFFLLYPRVGKSAHRPFSDPSLPQVQCFEDGVTMVPCLHLFYPFLCLSHLLYRSCSVSLLFFFMGTCFVCRCKFDVLVGGGEFGVFLHSHFGLGSLFIFNNTHRMRMSDELGNSSFS